MNGEPSSPPDDIVSQAGRRMFTASERTGRTRNRLLGPRTMDKVPPRVP